MMQVAVLSRSVLPGALASFPFVGQVQAAPGACLVIKEMNQCALLSPERQRLEPPQQRAIEAASSSATDARPAGYVGALAPLAHDGEAFDKPEIAELDLEMIGTDIKLPEGR